MPAGKRLDRGIRYRFRKSEAWIGKKIEHLEHEDKGRSHDQNIAIAESMAGNSRPRKNAAAEGGRHGLCGAIKALKAFAHGSAALGVPS